MRWPLLVLSVLLSGCLGEEVGTLDAEGTITPVPEADDPYRAYDGRIGFTAAGFGGADMPFTVADGVFDGVRFSLQDDSVWSGDLRLWLTAPSGQEHLMMDSSGAGAAGGYVNSGLYTSEDVVDYEAGTWLVTVRGTGSADMHVIIDVE